MFALVNGTRRCLGKRRKIARFWTRGELIFHTKECSQDNSDWTFVWRLFDGEQESSLGPLSYEVFHGELFSNFFNIAPIACPKPEINSPAKVRHTKVQSELS